MSSPIHNRIGNVFIPVGDMDRAIAWYSRLFGLQPGTASHDGKIYDLPMQGDTGLILDSHRAPLHPPTQPLCFFWTDDMAATYQWLQTLEVEIVTTVEDIGSVSFLTFKDPDQNLLMVCQRNA
jgi:predicted enzyme related to lactoylglutathione lyase